MSVETDVAVDMFEDVAGNSGTSTVSDNNLAIIANDFGVDVDLVKEFAEGDNAFAELVKSSAGEENKSVGEDYDGEDANNAPDENSTDDGETETQNFNPADDKNSGADGEKGIEYADNVIPGLSGRDIANLPDDAKLALADFYNEAQAKTKAAQEYEARIAALMRDPVVKARATAIEAGRSADLQVRGLQDNEKKGIAAAIQEKMGMDESEVSEIMSILEDGIERVAKDMATDISNRAIAVQDTVRQQAEINKQGNELLLSLHQYNKNIAVNETDMTKFYKFSPDGRWAYNEAHPEIEKFKNGIGKIAAWAGEHGIDNAKAVKMGGKALYAAAAAALDMPVALNVKERDAKIAAAAKQKALAPFLKSSAPKTLNTQGTDSTVNRNIAAGTVRNGYDIERLASDKDYYQNAVNRIWGDFDAMEKIEALAAQGQKIIDSKKRR